MTWGNRLRLAFGLLAVVLIVGACTVVFTQRQTRAESTTASITAEGYEVGSAYPGTVVEQLVAAGDLVEAGDELFEVRSPQLARDLAGDSVTAEDLGVPVTADGTYTVLSTVDGTVSEVLTPVGDFAGAGTMLATIIREKTLAVEAEFTLSARDYGRIAPGTTVDLLLPNDQQISGTVSEIEVETVGGQANSTITVDSGSLSSHAIGGLYQPGTPVTATLQLRDDGPWAGAVDALSDFVRKIGL